MVQANRGRVAALLKNNTIVIYTVNLSTTAASPNITPSFYIDNTCNGNSSSQFLLQPETNILVFSCYNSSFISEYILNNTGAVFKRLIPLYSFSVGWFSWFKGSRNFYFLPVTLSTTLKPFTVGEDYILVMMYNQPSGSSMKKIVNTTDVIVDSEANCILYAFNDFIGVF